MPTPTVPFGPLVSWQTYTFQEGRSLLLPGWHIARTASHGKSFGQSLAYDRLGKTIVPVEMTLTWEYLLRCDPIGDPLSMQTQMDALMELYFTNQVGTLIVQKYGGVTVSGPAALEDISESMGLPTAKKLNLSFFCPSGLS